MDYRVHTSTHHLSSTARAVVTLYTYSLEESLPGSNFWPLSDIAIFSRFYSVSTYECERYLEIVLTSCHGSTYKDLVHGY